MRISKTEEWKLGGITDANSLHPANIVYVENCPYCQGTHRSSSCPKVKSFEYFENGAIKRVEFKTAADYEPSLSARTAGPANVQSRWIGGQYGYGNCYIKPSNSEPL